MSEGNNPSEISAVPTYALYGELGEAALEDWLHCESIAARSSLFDWEIGLHRHASFFQILHISKGSGVLRLGDDDAPLRSATLLTVPPQIIHGFAFSRNIEGHVITLRADRLATWLGASPLLSRALTQPRLMRLDAKAARTLGQSIATIAEEFSGSRAGRLGLIEAHLSILLIHAARAAEPAVASAAQGQLDRYALEYRAAVDRDFRVRRQLGQYAEALGISITHLNRVSRAAFGVSALGLLNRRIILEATRDLTFTLMSVKEIAFSLGFEDPAYFTRFFSKQTGTSPRAFRNRQSALSGQEYGHTTAS